MEASHPKSHIEQGCPETIFLQYPTAFEQYPALFYILPPLEASHPKKSPKKRFLRKIPISGSE